MIDRALPFLALAMALAPTSSAQEQRRGVVEELQTAPEGRSGEWVIGGQSFLASASTVFGGAASPTAGTLMAVEYLLSDGVAHALRIDALTMRVEEVTDGPYVLWKDPTTAEVITFENGKSRREVFEDLDRPRTIKGLPGPESQLTLDPRLPTPPASSFEAPSRLLAISDLEGQYDNARRFLCNNGVVDAEGRWTWGDGHLVLIGDLVDRGPRVTELMCFLRQLEREAQAAGGMLHYVLGNHEAMVMAGDLRYLHPKYHFTSRRIGIPYDALHSPASDIGRWWRTKNSVVRVGELLFVHAGYSPLLDRAQLDMDTLNDRVRQGLAPARPRGTTVESNPAQHMHGPLWYRGYFDRHAAQWGGKATDEEVQRILRRHGARHIVIGHTLVDEVGPIDESGRILAIDTQWTTARKAQGLLCEDGKLWRVTMSAERTLLTSGESD